ncbi:hypothetical protein Dimus_037637 [Dionaea muscipula]
MGRSVRSKVWTREIWDEPVDTCSLPADLKKFDPGWDEEDESSDESGTLSAVSEPLPEPKYVTVAIYGPEERMDLPPNDPPTTDHGEYHIEDPSQLIASPGEEINYRLKKGKTQSDVSMISKMTEIMPSNNEIALHTAFDVGQLKRDVRTMTEEFEQMKACVKLNDNTQRSFGETRGSLSKGRAKWPVPAKGIGRSSRRFTISLRMGQPSLLKLSSKKSFA